MSEDFKLEYPAFRDYLYNARLSYIYSVYTMWPNKNNSTFAYYEKLLKFLKMALENTVYVKLLVNGMTYSKIAKTYERDVRTIYSRVDLELEKIKRLILTYENAYFYLLKDCNEMEETYGN